MPPRELKRWLDEGRPVTLLDTRNDYEVKLGTFKNAVTLGIDHFRNFPDAVGQLPAELKQQPIVMFCTGGIRCEKAGPLHGARRLRATSSSSTAASSNTSKSAAASTTTANASSSTSASASTPSLAETENTQCFNCLAPLSAADKQDPRYVYGESCPHCFLTDAEQMARTIAERARRNRAEPPRPCPAASPTTTFGRCDISAKHDGQTLLDMLCDIFPQLPREYWHDRFDQQLLLDRDRQPVAAEQRVRAGERYLHRMPATSEPDVNAAIRVLHEDDAIVVLEQTRPAAAASVRPIQPQHAAVDSEHGLLSAKTAARASSRRQHDRRRRLRPHRHFAGQLQPQFAAGERRESLSGPHPRPSARATSSRATRRSATTRPNSAAARSTSKGSPPAPNFACSHDFADGTSLVEARPITGRTNQIRVHLWHLGWPIVGEQAYLPNQQLGDTQTHALADPPLCLHSHRITFDHPLTGERTRSNAPPHHGPSPNRPRTFL